MDKRVCKITQIDKIVILILNKYIYLISKDNLFKFVWLFSKIFLPIWGTTIYFMINLSVIKQIKSY